MNAKKKQICGNGVSLKSNFLRFFMNGTRTLLHCVAALSLSPHARAQIDQGTSAFADAVVTGNVESIDTGNGWTAQAHAFVFDPSDASLSSEATVVVRGNFLSVHADATARGGVFAYAVKYYLTTSRILPKGTPLQEEFSAAVDMQVANSGYLDADLPGIGRGAISVSSPGTSATGIFANSPVSASSASAHIERWATNAVVVGGFDSWAATLNGYANAFVGRAMLWASYLRGDGTLSTLDGLPAPAQRRLAWPPQVVPESVTTVTFNGEGGHDYQAQYSLAGSVWANYQSPVHASSNGSQRATLPTGEAPNAQWRVVDLASPTNALAVTKTPARLLSFVALQGKNYQWETSTNLTNWETNGVPFAGTNNLAEFLIAPDAAPARFWRLKTQ